MIEKMKCLRITCDYCQTTAEVFFAKTKNELAPYWKTTVEERVLGNGTTTYYERHKCPGCQALDSKKGHGR